MDEHMENTMEDKFIPMTSIASGLVQQIAPDVYFLTNQIVNVQFVGNEKGWVLVDAGMPESADVIASTAERLFGDEAKPEAIVLTHGHFDHVGGLIDLVDRWDVPVYVHQLEMPFVTGKRNYPEPDGSVEGGLIAKMSPMFPNEGIDLGMTASALPDDHSVPEMPGWKWVHTPGHAPGHVSYFREEDRTLIAGDAFITVKQESLYRVLTQKQEISGPPRYLTTDWQASWQSVKRLQSLHPQVAITGHGLPMEGEELEANLTRLVRDFDKIAIPEYGKYI